MTPLYTIARDIDQALGGTACADAIEASTFDQSLVVWRFLAAVLRGMKPGSAKVQAAVDPVIAGMDRLGRGEEWPDVRAAAEEAWAVWASLAAAKAAEAAKAAARAAEASLAAASWAAEAADWAVDAGVSRARQRDILLRLIQEASE
jgi:hypothetical protein